MVLRILVLLTLSAACFAQTNKTSPSPQFSDDIKAIVAEANQGNVNAQLKLADAYLRGKGVDENDSEGFR
jgi:TPR repeat protein